MPIVTAQVIGVHFVAPGSIIPCVANNRGIDCAARMNSPFDMPITLSYVSGGKTVNIAVTPRVSATQVVRVIDSQTVEEHYTIGNQPPPDAGTTCTATVNVTIRDQQQQIVNVFDPVQTTVQFT